MLSLANQPSGPATLYWRPGKSGLAAWGSSRVSSRKPALICGVACGLDADDRLGVDDRPLAVADELEVDRVVRGELAGRVEDHPGQDRPLLGRRARACCSRPPSCRRSPGRSPGPGATGPSAAPRAARSSSSGLWSPPWVTTPMTPCGTRPTRPGIGRRGRAGVGHHEHVGVLRVDRQAAGQRDRDLMDPRRRPRAGPRRRAPGRPPGRRPGPRPRRTGSRPTGRRRR